MYNYNFIFYHCITICMSVLPMNTVVLFLYNSIIFNIHHTCYAYQAYIFYTMTLSVAIEYLSNILTD